MLASEVFPTRRAPREALQEAQGAQLRDRPAERVPAEHEAAPSRGCVREDVLDRNALGAGEEAAVCRRRPAARAPVRAMRPPQLRLREVGVGEEVPPVLGAGEGNPERAASLGKDVPVPDVAEAALHMLHRRNKRPKTRLQDCKLLSHDCVLLLVDTL
eukprot:CAMPEP_0177580176 /NCGR_PEP_ID=MMETSP0419_2-20121207/1407_1 /TAXON_ID=582737 /ORGANISM="Tetraselmis sp., Strain GSL018" /LENGTH=157 /DNA_ID=CAMNT_0019068999 /DNA_START=100 /DNA_END=573 /DNA_ORIENTATION=+